MKRIILFLCCIVMFGARYQNSRLKTNSHSGYTNGNFSVTDNGSINYNLQLSLSPGSAGVQPDLSIGYSSQGGNGLLGMGFSLQGFSVISRASQTIAQDGQIKGISFTPTDKFALDGERLVLVNQGDIYGGNGVEYRTEQNAFYKIISYGNINTPTHFKVFTNSGLIMEYGTTDDSRAGVGKDKTVYWLLDKVSDTKGNYYSFKYYRNNNNAEYYPTEINYTGNITAGITPYASVKFEYEDRDDITTQFISDHELVKNSKRITSIKNFYKDSLVRSYNFSYQYSSSNLTQLTSIQECGLNGECHNPTQFTYHNNNNLKFSTINLNSIQKTSTSSQLSPIDINADGVQDIIEITKGDYLKAYSSNKNPSNLDYTQTTFSPSINVIGKLSIADFNGDGKPDFLEYDSVNGKNILYLNTTKPTDIQIKTRKLNNAIPVSLLSGEKLVVLSDFNGDGRSDILSYEPKTGINNWMFSEAIGDAALQFQKNSSDSVFLNLVHHDIFKSPNQVTFDDFNNDGLTDYLTINGLNGEHRIEYNNGNKLIGFQGGRMNFFPPSLLKTTGGRLAIQDMNGDGLPDFLFHIKNTGETYWRINYGNTGMATPTVQPSNLKSLIAGGDNLLQSDFNSDGYTDLIWIDKSTGENKWFVNNGEFKFTQLSGNIINKNDLKGYEFKGIGNFTSKSYFDLFVFNNSLSPKTKIIKGELQYNNLLSNITEGSGKNIDVIYGLMTSDSIYEKGNDAVYPLMDFQASQFVVKHYETDDGIGGKRRVSYHYKGAKIHLEGRGFRGFSQVDVTDETSGITESKYYLSNRESWKYISSPLVRTTTKLPNGVIISDTKIENGLKIFYNGKCHYSFVKKNTSKTYETNGTFVDSTVTTQQYDDYGNVIGTVTDYGDGSKDSLVNFFNNDPSKWILGRLTKSTLYRISPNTPTIVKNSAFEYDMAGGTGLLTKEIVEPDSGDKIKIIKSYTHDAFGNIIKSSVSAWNGSSVETRTTSSVMDAEGRFTISFTNAIGHVSKSTYDPKLGNVLTETNPNKLTTQNIYDGMGRLIKTITADSNWVTTEYLKCTSTYNCPPLAKHLIAVKSSTGPPVIKYYDLLNREIRSEITGFNGQKVFTDVIYNSKGLVTHQSKPYFKNDNSIYARTYYDIIGRTTSTISPGNIIDSVIYDGRTTTAINSLGQKKTVIKNAKELPVTIIDNQGNPLKYDYDAAGRLIKITDPKGNTIITKYDIHGNKVEQQDPDLGTYRYYTNGFGELVSHTDSKNNTVSFEYDSLSRWTKRTETEGITTRVFDTKPNGIGLLAKVESYNNYYATYAYDKYGRVIADTQRIDGEIYSYKTAYDSLGRVINTTYPSGFSVNNIYNPHGYLTRINNGKTNQMIWSAFVVNAKGEMEQQYFGNGTLIKKKYDPLTDFLTQITTTKDTNTLQNEYYTYNTLGTLLQRKDVIQNKQEDFLYDDLNRLVKSQVLGMDSITVGYDVLGNITKKSDVGTYTYGGVNAGPHQVRTIDLATTQCIPSQTVNFAFNSFDKVKELSNDSVKVSINYNPNRMRNVQKMYKYNTLIRTKVYVSGLLEKEIKGNDTTTTHYINGPGTVIATYTTYSKKKDSSDTKYLHRDHLGTAVLVTNDTGAVVGRYSFDAWGKRRNADWSNKLTDKNKLIAERGFTGHEHYSLFNLVDMNGRIYDPVIGRFISADPFIQDITNLQSLNRYSYVLNNPLSFTDLSGYFFKKLFRRIKRAIKSVVKAIKNNWRQIVTTAVAITVGIATGGAGIFFSGAASGFSSSVTSTMLAGGSFGDALKAGIKGAVIQGVTAKLTFAAGHKWQATMNSSSLKTLAHGVIQGGATKAQGGKFIHGFYSGVATAATSSRVDRLQGYTSKVAASAVVGGTVSEISGGSFANGAISGAFVRMYNDGARKLLSNPSGGELREQDGFGSGEFGASRDGGRREHMGIDILTRVGQSIVSPITGTASNFLGATSKLPMVDILPFDKTLGIDKVRILYVDALPNVRPHSPYNVVAGQTQIGTAANLNNLGYPRGISPHIHIEIFSNNKQIDPTPFFFK